MRTFFLSNKKTVDKNSENRFFPNQQETMHNKKRENGFRKHKKDIDYLGEFSISELFYENIDMNENNSQIRYVSYTF